MFMKKIVDDARICLLKQLYRYYRMGVSCLLLSPTLRSILEPALSSPSLEISAAEGDFMSVVDLDICGMTEIFKLSFSPKDTWEFYLYLKSINTLSRLLLSPYQLLTLQYCTAETLVHLAFTMANNTLCCTHKNKNIPYIEELYLEQNVSQHNGDTLLSVSPFVIVEMLSVLSHYRLSNRSRCLKSLTDLQTLLLYDDGIYVPLELRDLSWQILGICQHVVGDLHGALHSYEESLRQQPYNRIKEATQIRIECVKQQLQENIEKVGLDLIKTCEAIIQHHKPDPIWNPQAKRKRGHPTDYCEVLCVN
ncbi:uncharacterized protein LOC134250496 [Saccostrea cucullata]|uniref:uncharacterized protein LOC134250496 n=1 Tax=Saccostrea cuccullata TaxID=36930 RepID=UPI002ED43A48